MIRTLHVVLLAMIALPLAACGGSSSGSAVKHLYFSQDDNANGLFELNLATGAATLVGSGSTGTTSGTIGLTETTSSSALLGSTWEEVARIAADGSLAVVLADTVEAEALAMNIRTGLLYGAINGEFFAIDPSTGLSLGALAAPGADIEGLAADPNNNIIYGISSGDTLLYAYDVPSNSWRVVEDTLRSWDAPGLAYDHLARVLYAVDANTDSLYTINPVTAATALVGPLGTSAGGGLAFVVE